MRKQQYIEENLFGCQKPIGTAQENYDSFFQNWGPEGLKMKDGQEITVDDIQEYLDENVNSCQKIASSISGWDPTNSGAKSDGYYECENKEDKIHHIKEYSSIILGIHKIENSDLEKIYEYLETDFDNQNDHIHAFRNL